jgi:hypothetical protein
MRTDIRGWAAHGAKQTRTPARANPNDLFSPRGITGRPVRRDFIYVAKVG